MKVEIEKKNLLQLLVKTLNIVEKKNAMPVLVNVLFEAQNSSLKIFATDLEVSLTDETACTVVEGGKMGVSARNLFDIVKELKEESLLLQRKENNWVEIRQGTYVSKIVGISHEEYPVFPTYSGTGFIEIPAQDLRDMIDKTIYTVSTDETRYHLNGVLLEQLGEKGCRMVSTDGHRLSLIERNISTAALINQPQGVIIPRKGLNEIRKLIDSSDGPFEIAIEGSQLIFKCGRAALMVRLIEGKYPTYTQFIPQTLVQKVKINKESFLSSLRRVALLANQKSKAITLGLSPGKMQITSSNPDLGDATEEIETDYTGSSFKIGFNSKYVFDVLSAIDDEDIDFEFSDQLSPSLIHPHGDRSYLCVVMPMRI